MKIIRAVVKPNSKKGPLITEQIDGSLILYVREPAIDGKANQSAIELLAMHFSVPKSTVTLKIGSTSRYKTFLIA